MLKRFIKKRAKTYVRSVEICNNETQLENCEEEDIRNAIFMPMDRQVQQFSRVVRADPELSAGFNAIGFAQGGLLIRGYVHMYNDPPVKTFVAVHSPMMGMGAIPKDWKRGNLSWVGLMFPSMDVAEGVYTQGFQGFVAAANYLRNPQFLPRYRKHCQFLPYINREAEGAQNESYRTNFASLERLVLVMAENDIILEPRSTSLFGFWNESLQNEVDMYEAPWYTENWFGLRDLDEADRIHMRSTPGGHLRITDEFLADVVKTYFAPRKAAPRHQPGVLFAQLATNLFTISIAVLIVLVSGSGAAFAMLCCHYDHRLALGDEPLLANIGCSRHR
jgi:palmitoyl-protein thioesterase